MTLNGRRTKGEARYGEMDKLYHSLFTKPEAVNSYALPSQRIKSVFNMGSGILDGFLFGWKIYRKFKKKK